ncbi:helix-turn-helix transcriptional regulator [Clostridium sp. DJ247]|uniref:helix-turn-helix domain-containing protein n=1 Tax=Clostridium sp. DJ247 TaxID=2726188 RepID=UPI0016267504|nr:helix-turn-helix transcriptional regulator [Clostridium sp. DJ247]MBC2581308.1 helix-turn-helix transcriptional regulator [Clostridium sp. DJ247]
MQRTKECTNFSSLGGDIKAARQAMNISRRELAEKVSIDPRYLANIENSGNKLPSVSKRRPPWSVPVL